MNHFDSEHRQKVQGVFNKVVPYYDTMNDLLSFGMHRLWKQSCVRSLSAIGRPKNILDLSTGTGDILIALMKKYPHSNFYAVDPDSEMLRHAQLKVAQAGLPQKQVTYIQSTAEDLLTHELSKVDILTCSFGLRNMSDIPLSLENMKNTLISGGQLRILEFAPEPDRLKCPYSLYRRYYLPFIGNVFFSDPKSYDYLAESIARFHTPEQVCALLERAGFRNVTKTSFAQGIVYLYEGQS